MSVTPVTSPRVTPEQRLECLCDAGTLEPLGPCSERVSVKASRGLVDGRPIVCYAQDSRVAGGSVGVAEAEVVVTALRESRMAGVPVVAFLESAGARLQEGAAALGGFGRIFTENVASSGQVPQISVITGISAGGGCYSPALTDFVVMTSEASMFLTGPRIVKQALGEQVTAGALGGAGVQQRNGVCDLVADDDHSAITLTRELLGYLPQNASEPTPPRAAAPAAGEPDAWLPPRQRNFYDVRNVIRALADAGQFLEVGPRWARNMVVGFARMEGHAIGVVANQPKHLGGVIDVDGSQKGAKFVRTCDAFGVPLVVLVDTPGFMPGSRQEGAGVIRHGADLLRSFASARCPRVTVVLRKAFGGAFITMNSKDLGADAAFAWPIAEIGVMGPRAAVEILHRRRLVEAESRDEEADALAERYAETHLSAEIAARLSAIDEVIHPAATRRRLADALRASGRSTVRRSRRFMRAATAEVSKREGCVIWFTGPPSSGKSTVAALVERELRARGANVELLDGDAVRQSLSQDLGFSKEDRDANIRRIAFVADVLSRNGVHVLVAAVSPYRETRDEVRAALGNRFVEVYANASLEERVRRDRRGLYAKALRGDLPGFTSVSDPYEEPLAPELVLRTERETPEESARRVAELLEQHAARQLDSPVTARVGVAAS